VAVARTANILEAHLATLPALRREPLKKKRRSYEKQNLRIHPVHAFGSRYSIRTDKGIDLHESRNGKEVQLTLDYDKHTAFFHDGAADAPTSAEFTADTISWEASWKAWQGHKQVTATCDYVLNRNTGSLHVGRGEGGRYSCSVSDKKF
jgi:hypothetical protein